MNDPLAKFLENRAIRYNRDTTYRRKLLRETEPTIQETLKKNRERKAA